MFVAAEFQSICTAMKSSSVIEGYTNLLKIGGVSYDYSETDNELLRKIVANGDNLPRFIEVEVPSEPQPSQPKTKAVTQEEHITLKGSMFLGIVLIVEGLVLMFNYDDGIIYVVASLIAGMRGKTVLTKFLLCLKECRTTRQSKAAFYAKRTSKRFD